ncbi:unnamed protein product [Ceutorhynchus assimilis]|uniref:DUF4371 domain-containing protein n=1 Tax=Ceutorhynchus assimilis TaxID=467358 RepID=A0A9N9QK04_9CUCU|nr:unnamed protein product [Ceutorhynchus assimilis]
MKKRFESGSAKRKKYMENKEKINKLPKLTQFFNKVVVTSCASTSASKSDDSINIENDETENDHEETISSITEGADVEVTHAEADQEQSAIKANEYIESTDSSLWPVSDDNLHSYWIDKGPSAGANRDSTFHKSARVYIEGSYTKTRNLCASLFKRQLRNGEVVDREWPIYSPSKRKKHAGMAASQHENSPEHRNCMMIYQSRLRVSGRIDTQLTRQFNDERQYWKEVLRRIVAVIKFLASRGLPFRGENENIGSVKNGNYLGTLELLSQFDPFLDQHIKKYGNAGKGNPSYLSATICEEFIELMGSNVLATIVAEVHKAKHYSVSVDSTPDVTHADQLTFILRYVKNAVPIERFLQFIHIYGHTAEYLADVVISFSEKNTIC